MRGSCHVIDPRVLPIRGHSYANGITIGISIFIFYFVYVDGVTVGIGTFFLIFSLY